MGGSSKKVTTGFWYSLGMHLGICYGPVDTVRKIEVDDRTAWLGDATTNTAISINQAGLFGGEKREGGLVGTLRVAMGGSAQTPDSYLQSRLGANIPAFRGILGLIWNGKLAANNPYIKPWAVTVRRILQGWLGGSAWYPEKAPIPRASGGGSSLTMPNVWFWKMSVPPGSEFTYWSTQIVDVSVMAPGLWSTPGLPFHTNGDWENYDLAHVNDWVFPVSTANTTSMWARKQIYVPSDMTFTFKIMFDSQYTLWIDGVEIWDGFVTEGIWMPGTNDSEDFNHYFLNYFLAKGHHVILLKFADGNADFYANVMGTWDSLPGVFADYDMNPAHIVYQTHTDPDWGMGYPTASINAANFAAVADTLYDEGFGLSLVWNQQGSIESFQSIIMDHIGGIFRNNPTTGLFEIKLIRGDYDPETLPLFDPSNCTLDSFQRVAIGETVNEVTVIYTDPTTGKDCPITVHNLANIQAQGGVVPKTVHYPGINSAALASRVAMRDLLALSTPLAKIRITTNRRAWDILPGDCIKLQWPKLGVDGVVYRVLKVSLGSLTDGKIQIDAAEDVFGLPSASYVDQEGVGWQDTSAPPAPAPYQLVTEAPYWDLTREMSTADLDYLTDTDCYLSVASAPPSSDAYDAVLWTHINDDAPDDRGYAPHCPYAILDGAHALNAGVLNYRSGINVEGAEVGDYLVVGGEYMRVDAIDTTTETISVSPGVLDTVPRAHADGEVIFFCDGLTASDEITYAQTEVVFARIQTRTAGGELDVSLIPDESVTMAARQARPYPPGRLRINSASYPAYIGGALTVSWAHRDRLQQTATIIDQEEASIGPEAGTTYNLHVYDGNTSALIRSYTGITGDSQAADLAPTVLLLHFDGANGSTSIVDSETPPKTVSVFGNTQISTAQSVFGGASGLFDGSGDYLSVAGGDDFKFSGDFVVDCRVRFGSVANIPVLDFRASSSSSGGFLLYVNSPGTLYVYTGFSNVLSATGISINTWYHVEVSRVGGVLRLFVDGVLADSVSLSANFSDGALIIGANSSLSAYLSGHLDELRIARSGGHTANFTVPASAYATDGDIPNRVRIQLESERDSLTSWQAHDHTFDIAGYGLSYGLYYGAGA